MKNQTRILICWIPPSIQHIKQQAKQQKYLQKMQQNVSYQKTTTEPQNDQVGKSYSLKANPIQLAYLTWWLLFMGRTSERERSGSETPKRPRNSTQIGNDTFTYSLPKERFSDLGGIQDLVAEIRELIERPLLHPEIYRHLGVSPPTGVLLHGPTGCGKTLLAHAIGGVWTF
jgi:ribosome biogenesis ATPase